MSRNGNVDSMGRNSKTILSTLLVLAIISYAVLCSMFSSKIPMQWVVLIVCFIELFYSVPLFILNYFKVYDRDLGRNSYLAFIPHVNYTLCMGTVMQIISHIIMVLFIISLALTFTSSWLSLMPDTFVLQSQDIMPVVCVSLFVIYNAILGLGLYITTVDVRKIYSVNLPSQQTKGFLKFIDTIFRYLPLIELPILLLPLIRSVSLIGSIDKMKGLIDLGLTAFTSAEEDL